MRVGEFFLALKPGYVRLSFAKLVPYVWLERGRSGLVKTRNTQDDGIGPHRRRPVPPCDIAPRAHSRGFLPWTLSDAGPRARGSIRHGGRPCGGDLATRGFLPNGNRKINQLIC